MTHRLPSLIFAAALLAACATPGVQREREATYDFGLPTADAAQLASIRGSVLVPDVTAPGWLDSPGISYRLAYDNEARTRIYALSRWVAPPASLVTQELRTAVSAATRDRLVLPQDGVGADWVLRVELEAFSQVFDTPDRSRALVRMRATLIRASERQVVAQRTFASELPIATADAPSGAKALAQGAENVVNAIVAWTASEAR